jgi:putative multiple sugar transport system permease protein
VIAAVFIGGASMSGGVGKIVGAVVGAFIMGVMNNGMSIMGIGIDYQQMIKGLVLLAAVIFDVYNKNKQADPEGGSRLPPAFRQQGFRRQT